MFALAVLLIGGAARRRRPSRSAADRQHRLATVLRQCCCAGVHLFGWRNRLVFDLSRLTRTFAADPDAVLNGTPTPIAKAPDQVDYRVRLMVQLVF